jgi:hypothetical protein
MTISRHTHAVEVAMLGIFSYFAKNVIEVNLTVVPVKCIIKELGLIAAIKLPLKSRRVLQANAPV